MVYPEIPEVDMGYALRFRYVLSLRSNQSLVGVKLPTVNA